MLFHFRRYIYMHSWNQVTQLRVAGNSKSMCTCSRSAFRLFSLTAFVIKELLPDFLLVCVCLCGSRLTKVREQTGGQSFSSVSDVFRPVEATLCLFPFGSNYFKLKVTTCVASPFIPPFCCHNNTFLFV